MPRFQVILSPEENERFSAYCEQKGHKKSTLAARLIREHLDANAFAYQAELLSDGAPHGAARAKPASRDR